MKNDLEDLVTQAFKLIQDAAPQRQSELRASLRDLRENSPLRVRPEVEKYLAKRSPR
jgi:hypothetical protein